MKSSSNLNHQCTSGFSLVEILIASSIAAMVVSASVSMLGTIATNRANMEKDGLIILPQATAQSIGIPIPAVGDPGYVDPASPDYIPPWDRQIPFAPSISLSRDMEILRSELVEDVSHAAAVFCVGRNSNDSYRNVAIPYPLGNDARQLAEPGRFEEVLNAAHGTDIFVPYRGAAPAIPAGGGGPDLMTNYSIYVIGSQTNSSGNNPNILRVLALYEVDFVPITSPEGTYVYMKQLVQLGNDPILTIGADAIEVFYSRDAGEQNFYPPFVQFERADRQKTIEPGVDQFKLAENKPFYFVWFPDPAAPLLEVPNLPAAASSGVRSAYASVSARTPYFFVIPMFPAL
ncbi:prepilin-type N-terminal cleavage/methylation domain-containing protein [Verrucomicrobiales bacterium]|nr:prepilin-type N-terminal cleavage/methylation domain-containing protein [Verrucomicrobiales bacterium]